MVRARKGMRKMNIVEALDDPDAAAVGLGGEPAEHSDVLLKLCVGKLLRLRITGQLQQRSERMAIPEKERIDALAREHVEIACPERFVIEEREVLRRVGVVVFSAFVSDLWLLHPDAEGAQLERRVVFVVERGGQSMGRADAVGQLERAVERSGCIIACDDDRWAKAVEDEGLFRVRPESCQLFVVMCEQRRVSLRDEDGGIFCDACDGLAKLLRSVEFARRGIRRSADSDVCACRRQAKKNNYDQKRNLRFIPEQNAPRSVHRSSHVVCIGLLPQVERRRFSLCWKWIQFAVLKELRANARGLSRREAWPFVPWHCATSGPR